MADITKKVDRAINSNLRAQTFTEADASQGDVILVKASLGRPARTVTIETSAGMSVKFNVYRDVYQARGYEGDLMYTAHMPNLTSGGPVKGDSAALESIDAGDVFELNKELPVNDIELVTVSGGTFSIFVA